MAGVDSWHIAHLAALGLWAGLVAAEGVVELSARTDEERRFASRLHARMDAIVELPLLCAVLLTGAVLVSRAWPLSPLHWVKVIAGLLAVSANLWCVVHVFARQRRQADPVELRRQGRLVRLTAVVGLPFAGVALYLGLGYFAG